MKLLLFSDVHNDLDAVHRLVEMSADVDVVVGAGDFGVMHKGVQETIDALSAITAPSVLVPGNNETLEELTAACAGWSAAAVCHGDLIECAGAAFFGLGGGIPPTPWDWSYDVTEADAARMLTRCPADAVLVLHSPPFGYLDGNDGRHLGSEALLEGIRSQRPRLAVCGHIHECWGQEANVEGTRVVNPGPQGWIVEI